MANPANAEVLVVGAGPVGLFAALALARRGIRVRIVDTGIWPCTHSYALALHAQSLRLFDELGLRDRVMKSALPIRRIGLYDATGLRAGIRLESDDSMAVVRQDALERLLEKALQEAGVRVGWRQQVSALSTTADGVTATVDRFEEQSRGYVVARTEWVVAGSTIVESPFVIGADGHNSQVRRAIHADFPEAAPPEYYGVFEFRSDAEPDSEMKVSLGERTTDVLWPAAAGKWRWSFQLPDYEPRQDNAVASGLIDMPARRPKDRAITARSGQAAFLEEERLRTLIAERAPWFEGSIDGFTWRTVARFERRLAAAFGGGRLWLAGDAAHLTGPVGVQSMNAGFGEASDLAERLAAILREGAPLDLLNEYGERWMCVWRRLHGTAGLPRPEAGADPWVVERAGRLLSCLPACGDGWSALARQLHLAV